MSQPTSLPSRPSSPTTPFSKVPIEVLLRISSHLTTPELGNLRLTCKSIEQSLFNTFMREFFTKRQFMLTEQSLQALVDISNSRLSDCLDHVVIGLNFFDERRFSSVELAQENAYRQAYADHRTLVSSGQDVVMLTEAFRNLKNLKTVGIRDYHSREREHRDGYGATWASYGATTIRKETGVDLLAKTNSREAQEYANKVMITLFTALGNAGARPKTFEMLRRQMCVPNDDAFNLFTSYLKPKVVPVLQGLQTFILVANIGYGPNRAVAIAGKPTEKDHNRYDYLLCQFLGYLTNIKHLRINFYNARGGVEKVLNWLSSPSSPTTTTLTPTTTTLTPTTTTTLTPTMTATMAMTPPATTQLLALPPSPRFPCLEELNFGFCEVETKGLLDVVRKFAANLKRLELYRVTLINRPPHNPNDTGEDLRAHYKFNVWAKMLKSLREVPGLNLEHIKIGLPNQISAGMHARVSFYGKGSTEKVDATQEYTGIDWKHYVGELAQRVKPDPPPSYPGYGDDGDGDDDDEEEDDEFDTDVGDMMDEEFMMMNGYYPDDMVDDLDDFEDMLMFETYGGLIW
ncbi:F-box domain-containing protein [Colletotrichum kahawae]|uniref:F-box domain-containing protein n=1 Tax=Colletotrichum kahawae TaxID=34407 RepID=A0AAD9YBY6_COLKA|nr:F-box domain-containing protein [Colletotrichum kahawae]